MASNELVNFFNIMFDKRQAFDIAEGILQDKRGLTGRVSFVGNPVSQPVFIMGSAKNVSVGNRCLCVRPKTSAKWIVLGSFGTAQTGYLPEREPEDGYEVYPPASIVAGNQIPGSCLWYWSSPPEKPVTFEVMTNTSASDTGAVLKLRTRGSYYMEASTVHLFLKVRTVTSTYNHSSWSDWYECAPGSNPAGTGTVTSVSLTTPAELTTAGSPVTTTGGFTVTWATQTANKVFAGPGSGGAAVPAFRDLVVNDLPNVSGSKLLGRYDVTSGKMQELAIGAGLYVVSDTLYASSTGGGGGGTPATGVMYKETFDINTEVVLFDLTISSDAPSITADLTLNALYSQCKDLRIVAQIRNEAASPPYGYTLMFPNGASATTGITNQRQYTRGASVAGDSAFAIFSENVQTTSPADSFTDVEGFLPDFNGSKRKIIHKRMASISDTSGAYKDELDISYLDLGITAPITQLELLSGTYSGSAYGNLKAGTRLTIYGTIVKSVVTDVTGDIGISVDNNKILGRYSPGSGQYEQLALGVGLYISGSGLYASAASGLSTEDVQDTVASFLTAGSHIEITYDDPGNTLTVSVPDVEFLIPIRRSWFGV